MPLSEDARLIADGIEVPSTKNYMIDRNGTVYAYIEVLDAAVESEMLIASTADGQEMCFIQNHARCFCVLSHEDALSLLHLKKHPNDTTPPQRIFEEMLRWGCLL